MPSCLYSRTAVGLFSPGSHPLIRTTKTNFTCKGPRVTVEQINFTAQVVDENGQAVGPVKVRRLLQSANTDLLLIGVID